MGSTAIFVPITVYLLNVYLASPLVAYFFDKEIVPFLVGYVAKSKVPFLFVFVGALLLIHSKIPVLLAQSDEGSHGYDNKHPRIQQSRLKGWGQRALAAHHNTYEAFPLFVTGAVLAHLGKVPLDIQIKLLALWNVLRVAYIFLYIAGIDALRSIVWLASTAAPLLLIWHAIFTTSAAKI